MDVTLTSLSLLLAASGGACGSVDATPPIDGDHRADADPGGDPDDPGDPGDRVAPEIVEITPADGATVSEDFSLVITFSEPMDAASVEDALVLPERADPVFTWNPAGDQLTVEPRARYPQNDDPDRRALEVAVGTGAEDRAGNRLAAERSVAYTLKYARLTSVFPYTYTLSGNCFADCGGTWTFLAAGEATTDPTLAIRAFLTLPFSLPNQVVIERAVLNTEIEYMSGDPFGFGDVTIDDVEFSAINGASFAAAGSEIGVLVADDPAPAVGDTISLDVTARFADDYQHRVERLHRTQFRMRFPHDDPADPAYDAAHADGVADQVRFLRPQTNLTVTYLVE